LRSSSFRRTAVGSARWASFWRPGYLGQPRGRWAYVSGWPTTMRGLGTTGHIPTGTYWPPRPPRIIPGPVKIRSANPVMTPWSDCFGIAGFYLGRVCGVRRFREGSGS